MRKLTKDLSIQCVGFSEFRGKDLKVGKGKIPLFKTPVGAMLWNI